MNYTSIEKFIKDHIKFKQNWNKKHVSMQDAVWQPLLEDTCINGQHIRAQSLFKVFETKNFGWIVFHSSAKDGFGKELPFARRIFKY